MELLKQLRICFIGIPDAGKSTLIQGIIKHLTNKEVSPDTLMNEVKYSDGKDIYGNDDTRTIKAAKILLPYKDFELMLIDAPGHLEYEDQICQAIEMSSVIVKLIDVNRESKSYEYINNRVFDNIKSKVTLEIKTHTDYNNFDSFNPNLSNSHLAIDTLLSNICNNITDDMFVDVEEEANNIAKNILNTYDKKAILFSGGKDSIVGYDICKKNSYNDVEVIYPESGFDFDEVYDFINSNYPFAKHVKNIPDEINYNNTSVFDIHIYKGDTNIELEKDYDLLCINYRASDEGVRSKDYHIKLGTYCRRFSPVFYFSEENIWRYIAKYGLKFPRTYLNGYRSLGDEPVTVPCMICTDNIYEIIEYIHNHPFEERDGRKSQDNTEKYTMERLRNNGFF